MPNAEHRLLEPHELSKKQRRFVEEHPISRVYSGHQDSVIVYEYSELRVDRYIIKRDAKVLDHESFRAGDHDRETFASLANSDVIESLEQVWDLGEYDGPRP
jgi:uncharacterized membrane protein (UPF0182 family)